MRLKNSNEWVLYSVIIVLLIVITYLRMNYKNEENKQKSAFSRMMEEKWLHNNTLNKYIKSIEIESLTDGKAYKPNLQNLVVVFVNKHSCDNCNEDYQNMYDCYKNSNNFIFIYNYEIITQFNGLRESILKYKNIYWDKNNNVLKTLNIADTNKKSFCLLFKQNVIIASCFIDDKKNVDNIACIINGNSFLK